MTAARSVSEYLARCQYDDPDATAGSLQQSFGHYVIRDEVGVSNEIDFFAELIDNRNSM